MLPSNSFYSNYIFLDFCYELATTDHCFMPWHFYTPNFYLWFGLVHVSKFLWPWLLSILWGLGFPNPTWAVFLWQFIWHSVVFFCYDRERVAVLFFVVCVYRTVCLHFHIYAWNCLWFAPLTCLISPVGFLCTPLYAFFLYIHLLFFYHLITPWHGNS